MNSRKAVNVVEIVLSDNLEYMRSRDSGCFDLIYADPPFNTGKVQRLDYQYDDSHEDYESFIRPRMEEMHRVLSPCGSLYFHIDYREAHYCKVMLDSIFGRDNFLNEIIWAYDYGARQKRKWPTKHDTILVYVKDRRDYTFNYDSIDRIPYMSPGLVGPEKASVGKTPTDVWWHTIVPTNGYERTGYPTQKPIGIIKRIILASSNVGDAVLDPFAGSGTVGVVCEELGRDCVLVDNNSQAIDVMKFRLPTRSGQRG